MSGEVGLFLRKCHWQHNSSVEEWLMLCLNLVSPGVKCDTVCVSECAVGLSRYQHYNFDTCHKYHNTRYLRYDTIIFYNTTNTMLVYLSRIVINKTSVWFLFYQLVPSQLFQHLTNGINVSVSLQQDINEDYMVPSYHWLYRAMYTFFLIWPDDYIVPSISMNNCRVHILS